MRKSVLLILIMMGGILSAQTADEVFGKFKEAFLEKYWEVNPASASYNGLAAYDSILFVPSEENLQKRIDFYILQQDELNSMAVDELSDLEQMDYHLIENLINQSLFYLTILRPQRWNTGYYNFGGQIHKVLIGERTPLAKVKVLQDKLTEVPGLMLVARKNIVKPTVPHTKLSIQQFKGTLSLFETDVPALLEELSSDEFSDVQRYNFNTYLTQATGIVRSHINWLEEHLLPALGTGRDTISFRIGKKLYAQKFQYDLQTNFSADELYAKALAEKEEIHAKMKKITTELWPKYFGEEIIEIDLKDVDRMIDTISAHHSNREDFVEAIRTQIPELEAFVKENNIIELDDSKPLEVRETPLFMRGVAGASISAPGPYEKERPTYYNVTPLDHYTDEEAESYLREYNDYMLQILNIHEAIPGHYTQLVYANRSPSLIKSLFGNGTMIEGWACYVERMMLEEGYGNQSPELWLMYYKWNLRILHNHLIDYGIHTGDLNEKEVIDMLVNEAFQEPTEAAGKWKRAKLTSVQLSSYYAGLSEIYELREELKELKGEEFDLKAFHEQFLSYGSAPVKYIREMMLKTF